MHNAQAKERSRMRCPFAVMASVALVVQGSIACAFVLPLPKQEGRRTAVCGWHTCHTKRRTFAKLKPMPMAEDNESAENEIEEAKGFDSEGFAGYLAPYALALLASIVITAGFFKFVLLDY